MEVGTYLFQLRQQVGFNLVPLIQVVLSMVLVVLHQTQQVMMLLLCLIDLGMMGVLYNLKKMVALWGKLILKMEI